MNFSLTKPVLALVTTLSATFVHAEEASFKLEDLTCFDVISQAEEDSLFLIALLIGHATALTGKTEIQAAMLAATIERLDATCGENPEMPAIEALEWN